MRAVLIPLAAAAALALALALGTGAGAQGTTTLNGTVGFTIRLVDSSGNSVRHLDPGSYTIKVVDKSPEHNFHLTGPGVDKATEIGQTVEETGALTWDVTFQDGRYHFQCDAHPSTLFGDFAVGTATLPSTTTTSTPPPPPPPSANRLAASVGPGKTISVKRFGVKLASVKRGPAVLTVSDRSTAEWMRHFYAALKSGMPKDEALQAAEAEMRGQRAYAHPFHWAAFQLSGLWS